VGDFEIEAGVAETPKLVGQRRTGPPTRAQMARRDDGELAATRDVRATRSFSSPPPRAQLSISTPNTRFSRLAQLIATCRGVDGLVGSAPDTGGVAAPRPRCAGVTADRY
jgi:hypothetical protein